MLAERPDLFIGVDSSDFNLGLERAAEGRRHPDHPLREPVGLGVAALARSRRIARAVDRILVMFPFEEPLYEQGRRAGRPTSAIRSPT